MKPILLVSLAAIAFGIAGSVRATPPTVNITYSQTQDGQCAQEGHYVIHKEWEEELVQELPRINDLWKAVGPKLLATTEEITGREFSGDAAEVRLTLCNVPSESSKGDIKVNMRFALRSFTKEPVPLRYKVSIIYHELLHGFIDNYLPSQSPLLAEHAGEASRVRGHLHLLALEKAVYLRLDLKEELAEIIKIDGELPNGFYKRAWEIVNTDEATYLKFVDELKKQH